MLIGKTRIGLCAALVAAAVTPAVAIASASTVLQSGKVKRGTVVVNSKSATLYGFSRDSRSKSSCNGSCASVWLPVLTKGSVTVKAGSGLKQSETGRIKRTNGTYQVTYGGHPLYRFTGDTKAGQQNGENKNLNGGRWYVVSTAGKLLKPSSGLVGGY